MADDQMDEDLWAKTTSPETRFDLKTMIFDSSWKDGTTFMASKDSSYYRTLYDFKNGIWGHPNQSPSLQLRSLQRDERSLSAGV